MKRRTSTLLFCASAAWAADRQPAFSEPSLSPDSTSNAPFVDRTILRIHFRITDSEGEDMEMHSRPVDISVQRLVGESYAHRASQIDAAAKELRAEIDSGKAR